MKRNIFLILLLIVFGLNACHSSPSDGTKTISGLAIVEQVELLTLETFPVQIRAHLKGPDTPTCRPRRRSTRR